MTDEELFQAANLLALNVQFRRPEEATVEEVWLVLALAARLAERGVLCACQSAGDLAPYRDALARQQTLNQKADEIIATVGAAMVDTPRGKA